MNSYLMKGFIALFIVLLGAVFFWQPLSSIFSKATIVNEFVLQTTDGVIDSKSLRGKVVALVFAHADCGTPCAGRLTKLANAYNGLSVGDRDLAKVIVVSADPQRDPPSRVADYAKSFHPRFIGATGTAEEITALTEAFAANVIRHTLKDGSVALEINPVIHLVDADGRFIAVLAENVPTEKMTAALRNRIPTNLPPAR